MKNKGFTLIELLAVIVILAIIALIATPIVLNIINESRTNARQRSGELVANAVELAYQTKYASSGKEPTLSEVVTQLSTNGIDKATIDTESSKINTDDGIECTLSETSNKLTLTCTGVDAEYVEIPDMTLSTTSTPLE